MKEILERKQLSYLKTLVEATFKTVDPFGTKGDIFPESFTDKLILCPVNGYRLEEKQFRALIQACKSFNCDRIFFSEVEGFNIIELDENDIEGKYLNHYYKMDITNQNIDNLYDEYLKMELILENAIYTETGNFGVLVSHEEHAVLGGKKDLIDKFKEFYPEWVSERLNFKEMWEYYSKSNKVVESWYGKLIRYIYG